VGVSERITALIFTDEFSQPWGISDEETARKAKNGDERAVECILLRYRPLIEAKARTFYLLGADQEDIVQEGMIGLFKAIRDFRSDRRCKFRQFAEICVTRQIITAIKTANRQKHFFLNGYISLNQALCDDDDSILGDMLADTTCINPEENVLNRKFPFEHIPHFLSFMEAKVLESYLEGKSYQEISLELRCGQKSVDNALQRVKKKISQYLKAAPDG